MFVSFDVAVLKNDWLFSLPLCNLQETSLAFWLTLFIHWLISDCYFYISTNVIRSSAMCSPFPSRFPLHHLCLSSSYPLSVYFFGVFFPSPLGGGFWELQCFLSLLICWLHVFVWSLSLLQHILISSPECCAFILGLLRISSFHCLVC